MWCCPKVETKRSRSARKFRWKSTTRPNNTLRWIRWANLAPLKNKRCQLISQRYSTISTHSWAAFPRREGRSSASRSSRTGPSQLRPTRGTVGAQRCWPSRSRQVVCRGDWAAKASERATSVKRCWWHRRLDECLHLSMPPLGRPNEKQKTLRRSGK